MTVEKFGRFGVVSVLKMVCAFGCVLAASAGFAQTAKTDRLSPQIVRVSYVEGDVRVSRAVSHRKGSAWEQAVADLPMETGYSLVTGKGRAEIEFEDSSTAYLGENSVLAFTELSATEDAPYTALNLVSGTMTVNAKARFAGEVFIVATPASGVTLNYGERLYARVDSYLDVTGITPQDDQRLDANKTAKLDRKGVTLFYKGAVRQTGYTLQQRDTDVAWDGWVQQRVEDRERRLSVAMKASGLAIPVAGLAELTGQGKFFSCEPYGTCWEPTNGWDGKGVEAQTSERIAEGEAPATQANLMLAGYALPQGQNQQAASGLPSNLASQRVFAVDEEPFPCSPYSMRSWYTRDPKTLQLKLVYQQTVLPAYPHYNWAVCHAGSWVARGRRYAWVVGTHRHHYPPVHWVKSGGKVGFVPMHPRDGAGKTPENLKHGLLVPVDRRAGSVERAAYNPGETVRVLREAPREFRKAEPMPLQRAEAPQMMAHSLHNEMAGVRATDGQKGVPTSSVVARETGTPIVFNTRRESFTINRSTDDGGRASRGTETLAGRLSGGGILGFTGGGARSSSGAYGGGSMGGGARGGSTTSSGSGGASVSSHVSAPAASAQAASAPAASAAPASSGGHK